jgi:hypothetical protein
MAHPRSLVPYDRDWAASPERVVRQPLRSERLCCCRHASTVLVLKRVQQRALAEALADVPGTVPAAAMVLQAFRSMAPALERNRPLAEARHRVIAATPALRERELSKAAVLAVVVADALRARGLPEGRATLLAQVSTAALGHAIHTWVAEPSSDIDGLIVRAFADLSDFVCVPAAGPALED